MLEDDEAELTEYLDGDWGGEDGEASGAGALFHDTFASRREEDENIEDVYVLYAAVCSVQGQPVRRIAEVTEAAMRQVIRQFWVTYILPEIEAI